MATDLREQQRRGTRDPETTRPGRGGSRWPYVVGAIALVVVAAAAVLVLGQASPQPEVSLGSYADLALTEAREGGTYIETADPCYVFETIPGRGGPPLGMPCEPNEPTAGSAETNWVEVREGGPYTCTVSPPPCWDLIHRVLVEGPRR